MLLTENLLLPALLFTVIGIVIGVIVVLIIVDHSRGKNREKLATPLMADDEEETPGLPTDRFENVAQLFRERSSGRLVVEVDKKVYYSRDTAPRHVLQELDGINEGLINWLGKTAAPVMGPIKNETLPPPIAPIPAQPKSEAPTATSIVGQINEILQEVLEESSTPDRKISLMQEPSMGVVVWVDGIKYTGIEAVPDPTVKELIQMAVKKWERKNDLSRRYP